MNLNIPAEGDPGLSPVVPEATSIAPVPDIKISPLTVKPVRVPTEVRLEVTIVLFKDVPVKVGDELEYKREEPDDTLTYAQARAANYPAIGSQLDALYWERQGDDTQRKLYDVKIKEVKDKIPKSGTYKKSEVDTLLD